MSNCQTADEPGSHSAPTSQESLDRRKARRAADKARRAAAREARTANPGDVEAPGLWLMPDMERFWKCCGRTVYRRIERGIIPGPIKVGAQSNAFIPSEQRAARDRLIAARDAANRQRARTSDPIAA